MAARSKRSADERRLAQLREIANEGANRNCLECHQRGPTYVDMTIGSFVCTKCCGLLRGLNPPHRTKSITMTSFNDDELEFIKNRGNEFNRYVYLGTYDERSNLEKESLREEHKIREFMVQKYERKRWFVDPDIAQHKMQLDRRQRAAAEQGVSLTGGSISRSSSKPPATFATRSQPVTPAGGELWSPPPTTPTFAAFGTAPLNSSGASNAFGDDLFAMCKEVIPPPADPFQPSSRPSPTNQNHQLQRSFRSNNNTSSNNGSFPPPLHSSSTPAVGIIDPFGQISSIAPAAFDPFAAPTGPAVSSASAKPLGAPGAVLSPPPSSAPHLAPHHPSSSAAPTKSSIGDFADFDAAFGSSTSSANPASEFSMLQRASNTPLVPSPANANVTTATPATIASGLTSTVGDEAPTPNGASKGAAPSADRYAALAELDELFSGQKSDSVPKPNETISGGASSTDPWGNHQPPPVTASANPFSPTGPTAPPTTGSNNPWGSPAAPGPPPASGSSPNPFAMAANSWSASIPSSSATNAAAVATGQAMTLGRLTPSNTSAQSSDLALLTGGLAGVQLHNGRVTPTTAQWSSSGQSILLSSSSSSTGSASATAGGVPRSGGQPDVSAQTSASFNGGGGFPAAWGAVPLGTANSSTAQAAFLHSSQQQQQQQSFAMGTPATNTVVTRSDDASITSSVTGGVSGRGNSSAQQQQQQQQGATADWAAFGQLAWPNGTSSSSRTTTSGGGSGWPNGGVAGAGLAEVWPQMPTSASTPAFNAVGQSPSQQNDVPALSKVSGGVPQSFSVNSAFGTAQWPSNGTPNGAHQTGLLNGRASSTANPFSPNISSPLSAARICSTSNPFL